MIQINQFDSDDILEWTTVLEFTISLSTIASIMNFTDDICADCGGRQFIEFHGDYTCMSCGLVMLERMMTDDKEWRNFSEELGGSGGDRSRVGESHRTLTSPNLSTYIHDNNGLLSRFNNMSQPLNRLREENMREMFHHITTTLILPESIAEYAKLMLDDYYKRSSASFKGDSRRTLFASAAVYYASKSIVGAVRSSQEICVAMCLCPRMFHKVCTQMNDVLMGTEFEALMVHGEVEVTDTLIRMIRCIAEVPDASVYEVRKKVLLIYNRIKHHHSVVTYASEKMNAALIYMACMILKLNIKMKTVATCCNTSLTTIINIERDVKQLLASA